MAAMAFPSNPFTVLSYVSGPALLTNATALMLLSTSNRFARAVDRTRELVKYLDGVGGSRSKADAAQELVVTQDRVRLIVRALIHFYFAAGAFVMATMISIAGGVSGEYIGGLAFDAVLMVGVLCGAAGFMTLVSGSVSLVVESRLAARTLRLEAEEAVTAIHRALHPNDAPMKT